MDTERSRRHASKLLTYPITIGGTVHQHSGLTLSNQRLTPEGSRSLAGKPLLFLELPIFNKTSQLCEVLCMYLRELPILKKLQSANHKSEYSS